MTLNPKIKVSLSDSQGIAGAASDDLTVYQATICEEDGVQDCRIECAWLALTGIDML